MHEISSTGKSQDYRIPDIMKAPTERTRKPPEFFREFRQIPIIL